MRFLKRMVNVLKTHGKRVNQVSHVYRTFIYVRFHSLPRVVARRSSEARMELWVENGTFYVRQVTCVKWSFMIL